MYGRKNSCARAIALSARALDEPRRAALRGPSWKDGKIVGEGAEPVGRRNFRSDLARRGSKAIRDACRNLKTNRFVGRRSLYVMRSHGLRVWRLPQLLMARHRAHVLRPQRWTSPGGIVPRPKMPAAPGTLVRAAVGLPVESREMPARG